MNSAGESWGVRGEGGMRGGGGMRGEGGMRGGGMRVGGGVCQIGITERVWGGGEGEGGGKEVSTLRV